MALGQCPDFVAPLRRATQAEQAAHLRAAIANPGADKQALTERLIASVAAGAISPTIIGLWLSVARDPRCTILALRQPHSAAGRSSAIKRFARDLRNDKTFAEAWAVVGGSSGLFALMATFSVRSVHHLCKELGRKPTILGAGEARQQAMMELFASLCSDAGALAEKRPLGDAYKLLLPACNAETGLQWDSKDGQHTMRRVLSMAHPLEYSQLVLEECFPEGASEKIDLVPLIPLIRSDFSTSFRVLARICKMDRLSDMDRLYDLENIGTYSWQFTMDLMIRLAKRCERPYVDRDTSSRLWSLITMCLRKHESLRDQIDLRYMLWAGQRCRSYMQEHSSGLLFFAIRKWVRPRRSRTTQDDAALAELIGFMPERIVKSLPLSSLLKLAPPAARYQLLRLFLQHAQGYCYDIGAANSKDSAPQGFKLGVEAALLLPPHEALGLLERSLLSGLPAVATGRSGLRLQQSILNTPKTPHDDSADPEILRALLLRRAIPGKLTLPVDPAAVLEHLSSEELFQRRRKAELGRSPEDRAFWARSALCLSMATGDIDQYAETVLWARRFIKDPLVVKEIFRSQIVFGDECSDLLCVLPARFRFSKYTNYIAPLKGELEKANKLILLFLETATLAMREPGFDKQDWTYVTALPKWARGSRLRRVNAFQDRHNLSDTEVFETIWKPTLDVLIEAEAMTLHPDHRRLFGPPSVHQPSGLRLGRIRPPTMKFLDELAKARDKLWAEHRARENPSVLTLRAPWPRGLAVEDLMQFHVTCSVSPPYIESRAKAVVFGAPAIYLAPFVEDRESKKAIRGFVDSWTAALDIYIRGVTADGRMERIRLAWTHATESLSQGRLSPEEACRFWKPFFVESGVGLREIEAIEPKTTSADPAPPMAESPSQPVEWNPDSIFAATSPDSAEDKKLAQTYDDVVLHLGGPISEATSTLCGTATRKFWDLADGKRKDLSASTVDALVSAAILWMNSREGADTSLLMQPFPNAEEARFPAVYLDQDFLEQGGHDCEPSNGILRKFLVDVPVALLCQLGSSLLQRIEADEGRRGAGYGHVVSLLKLASQSDHPATASSLIQRFLLNLPRESGWHRHLFNEGLLRSLPPQEAQDIIRSFAGAFFENEQPSRCSALSQREVASAPVKVTTMKMLAQVLRNAPFVSPRFSVDVLTDVLRHTKHLDIHVAALSSLVSTAKNSTDAELQPIIFDALRQYAVPRASSLNERRPETEADWQAAEKGGPLPEVWQCRSEWPPILNLLLQASLPSREHGVVNAVEDEFFELLCEALRLSTEANQRWTNLFLKRHGFDLPNNEKLPPVPSFCKALGSVFEIKGTSGVLFDNWRRHILVNLNPGPVLTGITASVKNDHELAESNAGQHWLSLWNNQKTAFTELGGDKAASSFADQPPDGGNDGSGASSTLEECIWEMVEIFLARANVNALNELVESLATGTREPLRYQHSADRRRAILQRVVDRVDALRTPQWQADRDRRPVSLPHTLQIKLQMIKLLHPRRNNEVLGTLSPSQIQLLSSRIVSLISNLATASVPYHAEYTELRNTLVRHFGRSGELAVRLGSPESVVTGCSVPTLTDCLRVDLAAYMIKKKEELQGRREYWDADVAGSVGEMIEVWQGSSVEYIRDAAEQFKPQE